MTKAGIRLEHAREMAKIRRGSPFITIFYILIWVIMILIGLFNS